MDSSRRRFLTLGAAAGAFLGGRRTQATAPASHGQAPGPLAADPTGGAWRNMRAVREKKVIDFHCHCYQTLTQGSTYADSEKTHQARGYTDFSAQLVESMDRHGVARAAVSPHFIAYDTFAETAYKAHPDRLIKMTSLDLGKPADLTPAEAARITKQQLADGARGVGEVGFLARGTKYSVADLKPLVDVILDHDVPVIFHCGFSSLGPSLRFGNFSYKAAWRWAEELGELAAAYPTLKIVIGHIGGDFTFLDGYEALRLAFTFDNTYVDTSKTSSHIITEAVRGIGAERVLYGSDWNRPELKAYGPLNHRHVYQHWYSLGQLAAADITEDERDLILYRNAQRLLKLS